MCERTKTEVLARELAIEFYGGFNVAVKEYSEYEQPIKDYKAMIEANWKHWVPAAKSILKNLEEHKD